MTKLNRHPNSGAHYTLSFPASGEGLTPYSPVGGFRRSRYTNPAAPEAQTEELDADDSGQAPKKNSTTKPQKDARSRKSRNRTLQTLLAGLVIIPPMDAFLRLDMDKYTFFHEVEPGGDFYRSADRWKVDMRGKTHPHVLLQALRVRITATYPNGWFLYRWKLEYAPSYGVPLLALHLIGDPGQDHALEDVHSYLSETWKRIQGSDSPDLVYFKEGHAGTKGNFLKPTDIRLEPDLVQIRGRHQEFGKINRKLIPILPPQRIRLTYEQLDELADIIRRHILDQGEPNPRTMNYLRQLDETNFNDFYLNETTGPLVQAKLVEWGLLEVMAVS